MVPRSLHAEVPTARDSLSVPLCRAGTPQKAPTQLVPSRNPHGEAAGGQQGPRAPSGTLHTSGGIMEKAFGSGTKGGCKENIAIFIFIFLIHVFRMALEDPEAAHHVCRELKAASAPGTA